MIYGDWWVNMKLGDLSAKIIHGRLFSPGEGPVKFREVPLTSLLTTATRDALVDGADLGNAPLSKTIWGSCWLDSEALLMTFSFSVVSTLIQHCTLIVHYNMPTCWKSVQSKTSKVWMASTLFIKSVSELGEMITELTSSSREPRNVSGINNLLIVPNHLIAILYSLRWPPNIFICSVVTNTTDTDWHVGII